MQIYHQQYSDYSDTGSQTYHEEVSVHSSSAINPLSESGQHVLLFGDRMFVSLPLCALVPHR